MSYGMQLLMLLLAMLPQHHRKIFTPVGLSVPSSASGSSTISVSAGQALGFVGVVCWSASCSAGSDGTLNNPTDTLGNSITCPAGAVSHISGNATLKVCYVCSSASSGSDAVTFTTTGGTPNFLSYAIFNITDISTASCEDTAITKSKTVSGANPTIASAGNAGQSGEFMLGACLSTTITANQTSIITLVNTTNSEWTTGPASGNPQTMSWTAASHQYYAVILGLKHQ